MIIIGIIFYSIVFIFLIHRIIRNKTQLTVTELSLAFIFKVALGCLYGYIYGHFYNGDDTWTFQTHSLEELQLMLNDPVLFITKLGPAYTFAWQGGTFWENMGAWIHTLENNLIIKVLTIGNLFGGSNYYINVVFFNFVLFWGHYWLFKLYVQEFPQKRKQLLLLIFFFPPLVFWLSGIRGDGLVLFFLALLLVHFRRWLYTNNKWSVLYFVFGVFGIIIFRSQVLLLLIPALAAWYISVKFNRKPLPTFLLVFATGSLLFFATAWLSPQKNLPQVIAQRQQAFMALQGTRFPLDTLQPTLGGFTRVLPQALSHTFVRPYIWEAQGALQLMTAAAIIIFWGLTIICIIKKEIHWKAMLCKPLILFSLGFGITLYIFIGYTIPFPGAIVRYKAIPELLLLAVPVICTNWAFLQKINKKLYI
ncbi:hypothetical protein [Niastella sp. OAS944]|uniref:hypothetical protein n=1 Tax=Niastella sp. OAS944 TaxID=2664089 RepID=UPI00348C576E|nr:hypothetical protein [Chitinophagaceae bacterium OAS944]